MTENANLHTAPLRLHLRDFCAVDSAATLDDACLVSFERVIYGRLRSGCSDCSEGCRKFPLVLGAETLLTCEFECR